MPKFLPIPIVKADEPSCKVTLANGAVMIIRTVVISAKQIMEDNGKPSVNDDGTLKFGLDTRTLISLEKEPVDKKEMN